MALKRQLAAAKAEDSPGWDARRDGNKTGWYKGTYYVNGKPGRPRPNPRTRKGPRVF